MKPWLKKPHPGPSQWLFHWWKSGHSQPVSKRGFRSQILVFCVGFGWASWTWNLWKFCFIKSHLCHGLTSSWLEAKQNPHLWVYESILIAGKNTKPAVKNRPEKWGDRESQLQDVRGFGTFGAANVPNFMMITLLKSTAVGQVWKHSAPKVCHSSNCATWRLVTNSFDTSIGPWWQ